MKILKFFIEFCQYFWTISENNILLFVVFLHVETTKL